MRTDFPLVIAANRDEFYARPTAPSQFWQSQPNLLAGQDLEANGTWMGVTRNGKIAALTNVRDAHSVNNNAVSRGELVTNWLKNSNSNTSGNDEIDYLNTLRNSRQRYNGYNLLFGHLGALSVYNNVSDTCHKVAKGVVGLSNADIVTPWPKVSQGVTALNNYIKNATSIDDEDLFALLRHEEKAPDDLLPNTGIGYKWEKALSSIFINIEKYGTRTSTLLMIDKNNTVTWKERRFSDKGIALETREYSFTV